MVINILWSKQLMVRSIIILLKGLMFTLTYACLLFLLVLIFNKV
jgi:hypothetical protein